MNTNHSMTPADARDFLEARLDALADYVAELFDTFADGLDAGATQHRFTRSEARAYLDGRLNRDALEARAFTRDGATLTPRAWLTAHDLADFLAVVQQSKAPEGPTVATDLLCPPWCDHAQGEHPYTLPNRERGESSAFRVHRTRFGPNAMHAALELTDRAIVADGTVAMSDHSHDLGALAIAVYPDGRASTVDARPLFHLTPNGARRLAQQLTAAADLADSELSEWGADPSS